MTRKATPEIEAMVREMWAEGVPSSEISAKAGMSDSGVWHLARRLGLPKRKGGVKPGYKFTRRLAARDSDAADLFSIMEQGERLVLLFTSPEQCQRVTRVLRAAGGVVI
jgi:hypothetical protein